MSPKRETPILLGRITDLLLRRLVPNYFSMFYESLFLITALSELLVQTRRYVFCHSVVSTRAFWIKFYFVIETHLSCCYIMGVPNI